MRILIFLCLLPSFIICQESKYLEELEKWKSKRVENLKSESGWLNLAGLFWLEPGENTIGGGKMNKIKFVAKNTDDLLGSIWWQNGEIWYKNNAQNVWHEDTLTKNIKLFPVEGKSIILKHNNLRWFIIERGDKFAIRLRDLEGKYLQEFKGIQYFPTNKKYIITADFLPTPGRKIQITDVTGRIFESDSPGKVVFDWEGKSYSLEATGSTRQLGLLFGDMTSGEESYGGGRFLDAKGPDANNKVVLDFNKSYNPPCVFSPFATCPLPTKDNILKIPIYAGETMEGFDH